MRVTLPTLTFLALSLLGGVLAPACGEAVNPGGTQAMAEALAQTAGRVDGARPEQPGTPYDTLSPHRLEATVTTALTVADRTRTLTVRRTIDRGEAGRFRIDERRALSDTGLVDPPADEGREAIFDGEHFVTRRAWGPWTERETLHRDHHTWLRQAYDAAPTLWAGFGDYLVETPDPTSAASLAGVDVVWSALSLNPRVAPRTLTPPEQRALRDHDEHWPAWLAATHRPRTVSGAIARRVDTGAIVAGQLELSGDANVDGTEARFVITLALDIDKPVKASAFALPDERQPARRARFWRTVDQVLGEDLLPRWRDR